MRLMDALYYLFGVLILLLGLAQSAVLPHIRIAGVHPDLMLVLVVCWSMLRGFREGVIWALMAGIVLDLLSGAPFGMFTLSLVCAALLPGLGTANFFRSHLLMVLAFVALGTVCSYAISLLMLYLAGQGTIIFEMASRQLLPSVGFNACVALIVFPPISWLHRRTASREMEW